MTITITPQTPRKNILVGGALLSAPLPFLVGHVLTENEAAAINQTYLENIGNNFRSAVQKAKRLAILDKPDAKPEELKAVTDEQIKAFDAEIEAGTKSLPLTELQTSFDELIAGYQMGVRRASSVQAYTPEEKAARDIAKNKLKAALQKRGTKLNTVSADWFEREIGRLLDKENPVIKGDKNVTQDIWTTAERQVKLLASAAADALDELDMSGLEKTEAEKARDADAKAAAAKGSEPAKSPRNAKGDKADDVQG